MVGRKKEIEELLKSYNSAESEFVAVYGRRRVGKTFLIRNVFAEKFAFQHSGLAKGGMKKQLRQFTSSLREYGWTVRHPLADWMDAFDELKEVIKASPLEKKVVFIDEMPWLDTPRSDFITALESFWNGWASARADVLLVVCGSAASWIVKKLFKNKGGLHNRVTRRIHLLPFTLAECREYARERSLSMSRKDIAECYMALGGIPYYWSHLEKSNSVPQNFDRMFFADDAPLKNEFAELYSSLFRKTKIHLKVVEALGMCGARLDVLWPPKGEGLAENAASVVALLEYAGYGVLLTADLDSAGERRLLEYSPSLRADLLQVAHHGSAGSNTIAFLSKVAPRYAVVSVGAKNAYGHPAAPVMRKLAYVVGDSSAVYRTDQEGSVTFELLEGVGIVPDIGLK